MSEETLATDPTTPATEEVDPILTNDLTNEKPDAPLVPKNSYPMECTKVEQYKSENTGSTNLRVSLKSVEAVTSVTGEVLPAGTFTQRANICITPSPKLTQAAINRALKRFQLCFGITSGPFMPFDQYVGKIGSVGVGFSKKTPDYPDDRNEVKSFNPPKN